MRFARHVSILFGLLACTSATAALATGCSNDDASSQPASVTDSGTDAPVDAPVDAPAASAHVIPPTGMIDGKTYAQESAAWWQWALAIPKAKNPIEGQPCGESQSGNVFYLTGTADSTPATRTCEIPEGKTVFFPLLNTICYPCPEVEGCGTTKSESELKDCVTMPTLSTLEASIDGVAVPNLDQYLATSAQFTFKAPATDSEYECTGPVAMNTCGIPEGDRYGMSGGYWLAVDSLAKGKHTIKYKAVLPGTPATDGGAPGDDFVQDVSYDITIK
jgi:hypothetical protein